MYKKAGGKHYTTVEKKILLEILKKYKDFIETKKSDSSTLKEKDAAWSKVTEEYNMSNNIIQEVSLLFIIYNNISCVSKSYIYHTNILKL